jgi:hypothetical protein
MVINWDVLVTQAQTVSPKAHYNLYWLRHITASHQQTNLPQTAAFLPSSAARSSHLAAEPLQNKSAVKGQAEYQHVHSLLNLSASAVAMGAD